MKSSKKKRVFVLVIILFTVSIITLIISLTSLVVIQEVKTLDIQLKVADHMGFNVDADKLYFGTVPQGNTGSRDILIENKEYKKSVVRLKIRGELKGWVTASENNFILKKEESKLIKMKVTVPEDAELKDYESKLLITFTRL